MDAEKLIRAQLRPIIFEGKPLPRSASALDLLAQIIRGEDAELAKWLSAFPDCSLCTRSCASLACYTLAGRARDLMLDHRGAVLGAITARFGAEEAEPVFGEWMTALQRISELAAKTEGDCEWHAPANPDDAPIMTEQLAAMRRYLDGLK